MAEFEKAVTAGPDFIAERVKHLRSIGDSRFLARQHAMHMQAYQECRCPRHDCGGCRVTLAIAAALERELPDGDFVLHEQQIALSMWERKKREARDFLLAVSRRFWKQPASDPRAASIARDEAEEAAS